MADTRKKILDTAERLFASKGIDAVSLRQINASAGVSPSVLHYHFGGRDELIEAMLERRLPAIGAQRAVMLDNLKDRQPTLRELMEVTLLPLAQLALEGNKAEQRFVKVLARLHLERNAVYERVAMKHYPINRPATLEKLIQIYPQHPPRYLEAKMAMAINTIFSTLAQLENPLHIWQTQLAQQPLSTEEFRQVLLEFICTGMVADDVH